MGNTLVDVIGIITDV